MEQHDGILAPVADDDTDAVVRYCGADEESLYRCTRQLTIWGLLAAIELSQNALAEIEIEPDRDGGEAPQAVRSHTVSPSCQCTAAQRTQDACKHVAAMRRSHAHDQTHNALAEIEIDAGGKGVS